MDKVGIDCRIIKRNKINSWIHKMIQSWQTLPGVKMFGGVQKVHVLLKVHVLGEVHVLGDVSVLAKVHVLGKAHVPGKVGPCWPLRPWAWAHRPAGQQKSKREDVPHPAKILQKSCADLFL